MSFCAAPWDVVDLPIGPTIGVQGFRIPDVGYFLRIQMRFMDFLHLLLNASPVEVTLLGCSKTVIRVQQFRLSLASAQAAIHWKTDEFVKPVRRRFQGFLIVIIEG